MMVATLAATLLPSPLLLLVLLLVILLQLIVLNLGLASVNFLAPAPCPGFSSSLLAGCCASTS